MYRCFQRLLSKSSNSSGVTLIELMVSLFVFAIGMLAVTAMCLMSIHGNSLVNQMTQANFLAQSEMEVFLSELNKSALCNSAVLGNPTYNTLNFHVDSNVISDPLYDVSTLPECKKEENKSDFRITVVVDWADSKGNHEVELKTLSRVH